MLCALTVSGIASDRFTFMGFLPNKSSARKSVLREVRGIPSSLIFYESPRRLGASLKEMRDCLGADRYAAVCRELTKKFEEVTRGTLEELAAGFAERSVKGEIVVVVDRGKTAVVSAETLGQALTVALQTLSVKAASILVAERFGFSKREAYQMALKIGATK